MGYNVLIVDDMPLNRKLITKTLKQKINNITFYEAEDGERAIECVIKNRIDLLILDLIMPVKDGFAVLKELKDQEEYKHIPVIVNSAMDEINIIEQALELGATDYFTKPLTLEQMEIVLPIKVKNALKSYEQKRQLLRINQRMKEELKFANALQSILIEQPNEFMGASVIGKYIPSAEVSGDFYECIQIEDKIWFLIADVSGHGVAAAMISSMIKVMFNSLIRQYSTPAEVLRAMNATFFDLTHGTYYITAFLGLIEGEVLTYSNGGHPYPILIESAENKVEMLEQDGFLIGIVKDYKYDMYCINIAPGDSIFMYTDGLLEPTYEYGVTKTYEDVRDYIACHRDMAKKEPELLVEYIIRDFEKSQGAHLKDDIAIFMIKRK